MRWKKYSKDSDCLKKETESIPISTILICFPEKILERTEKGRDQIFSSPSEWERWRRISLERWTMGLNSRNGFISAKTERLRRRDHLRRWTDRLRRSLTFLRHLWFTPLYLTRELLITRIYLAISLTCTAGATHRL